VATDLTGAKDRAYCRHRYPDGHLGWFVTDHKLGRAILSDPRFSGRPLRSPLDDGGFQEALSGPESAGDLARIDPPDHTRVRRTQTAYFTVRRVSELRAKIEEVVDLGLDAMEAHGAPADFVELFSAPVPAMVICDVLGVPREDRVRFEEPTGIVASGTRTTPAEKRAAVDETYAYIREVIAEKRAKPSDDLLGELINGGELNDNELAGTMLFLFAAGHGTVVENLGLSVFFLLSERERWEAARANLPSIDRTVEELLRLLSPIPTMTRTATADFEIEDGAVIKAGEAVTVCAVSPAGDPEKVGDPYHYDPSREPSDHLAFGWGRHMCLGQHLARLELQVALAGLMRRFPSLRLAVPAEEVPMRPFGYPMPGRPLDLVERLLVAW
jgi:cytochrome P450